MASAEVRVGAVDAERTETGADDPRTVSAMLDQMDFYLRCIKPARPEHLSASSLAWLHVAENALKEAFERLPV